MAKQLSAFEKEFAAARAKYKADKGTNPLDPKYNFDFKGKKYNVEYAEEKQARKGGKSSSASPSKSPDSSSSSSSSSGSSDSPTPKRGTGAPTKDRSKMTYKQMMEAGKDDPLVQESRSESSRELLNAIGDGSQQALTAALFARLGAAGAAKGAVGAARPAAGAAMSRIRNLFGSARGTGAAASTARGTRTTASTAARRAEVEAEGAATRARNAAVSPTTATKAEMDAGRELAKANRAAAAQARTAAARARESASAPTVNRTASKLNEYVKNLPKSSKDKMRQEGQYSEEAIQRRIKRVMDKEQRQPDTEVPGMKRGGKVKFGKNKPFKAFSAGESPAMVKKEMAFMRKKGAPKSMIAHEKKELPFFMKKKKGMNCGGKVMKYAAGGAVKKTRGDGICRVKTKCKVC